jgi:membrane associated rhomboid family serine protease
MPPLTRLLLGANVAVFALDAISGPGFLATFALWPVGHFTLPQFEGPAGFKLWQLITCGFLHANLLHLGINMYALWMFGSEVERTVGPRHYLTLYFASLLCSSATQLLVVSMKAPTGVYPTVGASGSDLRSSTGFRHAFSKPHNRLDLSADSDAGDRLCYPLRAS